jgi:hypothetical protein
LTAPAAANSREERAAFVRDLARTAQRNPEAWVNRDLPSYLEALAAFIGDMDGYFRNQGQDPPSRPDWSLIAKMLLAASVYE